MLLSYPNILKLIRDHIPDPDSNLTINQMLNKLYIYYRPDYQGDPVQATYDLEHFEYSPDLDSYKPIQNGTFGAIHQIVQSDMKVSGQITTDTSNPCLVASYVDTLRFNNVKKALTKAIPNGGLHAIDNCDNQAFLVYEIENELNRPMQSRHYLY